MTLLLIYLAIAIGFSFLCSVWEAVLLSITHTYISILQSDGDKLGDELAAMKEDIDRPLSAILTLNTVAHTFGAAGVGAQAAKVFGDAYLTVISIVLTLLILVFSEIIPKTIGASYWKSLAGFTSRSLRIVMVLLAPFVWMSQLITKLFKGEGAHGSVLSRADFSAMADIGAQSGSFTEGESMIIKNLVKFNKIEVQDIMTPRTVMVSSKSDVTINEFYNNKKPLEFSRIPLYPTTMDDIGHYVLKDEVLASIIAGKGDESITSIQRPIIVADEHDQIDKIFNRFMKGDPNRNGRKQHIAVVEDARGTLTGLVTLEDIVETLLGLEIVDEMDRDVDMQERARRRREARLKQRGGKA